MPRDDVAFDLVVLADLTPGRAAPTRAHRVDRDELAPLLASLAPAIVVDGASLTFRDFRDFRPEALAAALPTTRALLALRRRLDEKPAPAAPELLAAIEALEPRTPALEAVRAALQGVNLPRAAPAATVASAAAARPASPSPAATTGEPDVEAILRMVDAPAAAPDRATETHESLRRLDAVIAAIGAARRTPGAIASADLRRLAAALDEALAGDVRAALHHPAFQALESAWLGLRFLVRRADFRSGLRLHVVPCALPALPPALREAVAPLAAAAPGEGRAVCAIAAMAAGPDDLAAAAEAAAAAMEARVPLVMDAAPALLGAERLADLGAGPGVAERLEAHGGEAWRALRESPGARGLALAINRVLLRTPYGEHHEPVRGFAFEEHPAGAAEPRAWGAAALIVGARLAAQAAESGWAVDVAGPPEEATSDLPVRPLTLATGETVSLPLEALLSEPRALQCSEQGLLPLVCRRNHDAAWIPAAPTVAAAGTRDETRRATLAYALWLAHLTALLTRLHAALDPGAPRADRVSALARGLEYLAFGADGPLLRATAGDPGEGPVTLTIHPLRPPLAGLPDTTVEVPV